MRQLTELAVGTWRRTLIVGAMLLGVVAGAVLLVATFGGDLRHANLPGRPWPPTGYYRNPFSNSPDDLLSRAEAAHVRADLLRDGEIELDALASGDTSRLGDADTGNALAKLEQLVTSNNAAGVAERQQVHLEAIVVGRLADPATPNLITWCVEERGSGTITRFRKASSGPVESQNVTFTARFWLVKVGERYLITDVEVRSTQG